MFMLKKKQLIYIMGIWIVLQSCASWNTLQLNSSTQPILLGSKISADSGFNAECIERIEDFSCEFRHEVEEGSYSESEHISVELGGYEQILDNTCDMLNEAFVDDTLRFIADVQIEIEVGTGISLSNVLAAFLASLITDNESSMGSYQNESFKISGMIYRKMNNEK